MIKNATLSLIFCATIFSGAKAASRDGGPSGGNAVKTGVILAAAGLVVYGLYKYVSSSTVVSITGSGYGEYVCSGGSSVSCNGKKYSAGPDEEIAVYAKGGKTTVTKRKISENKIIARFFGSVPHEASDFAEAKSDLIERWLWEMQ